MKRYRTAGPYMLEVGISSTLEIARFWGIADGQIAAVVETKPSIFVDRVPPTEPRAKAAAQRQKPRASADRKQSIAPASGVQKVIEDALRAAGLLR